MPFPDDDGNGLISSMDDTDSHSHNEEVKKDIQEMGKIARTAGTTLSILAIGLWILQLAVLLAFLLLLVYGVVWVLQHAGVLALSIAILELGVI